MRDRTGLHVGIALALAVLTIAVFAPVRHFEFVSIDDPLYVTENPHVLGGISRAAVAWAFTAGYAANWHPLTWLSHMLDVQVFGLDAGAHHAINLALHLLTSLLLFFLLQRMTRRTWPSAFVAALFAVHPLHVESVAWVAERKDVLSALFWMLTLHAYVSYTRVRRATCDVRSATEDVPHFAPRTSHYLWYVVLLLCYALGLMAKPMLVTLPVVLLLLDYWPLSRRASVRTLVIEKLPLFALAAASMVVTFLVQRQGGAVSQLAVVPLPMRLGNAAIACVTYAVKMVWPAGLSVFYRYPESISTPLALGAALVLACISALAVRLARTRPYVIVGWLWYLVTLLPVAGIVQVGRQAMADRYTYIPLVGLFIVVAWGVAELAGVLVAGAAFDSLRSLRPGKPTADHPTTRPPDHPTTRWVGARRVAVAVPAVAAILGLAVVARAQVTTWASSDTLWRHALAVDAGNYYAHNSLGTIALDAGRTDEAAVYFSDAVRYGRNYPEAYSNLGLAYARLGRLSEAIAQYRAALSLNPNLAETHDNLGVALTKAGRHAEALVEYEAAIRLRPDVAVFHHNIGQVLVATGRVADGVEHLRRAVALDPADASAHVDLGKGLAAEGRMPEAVGQFSEAVRLAPEQPTVHTVLALALAAQGRIDQALPHFADAVRLQPGSDSAHQYFGIALAGAGRFNEAIAELREAVRLNPGNDAARRALDMALARVAESAGAQR